MTDKPKRGRPPGTGKNDEPHLLRVARLMIEDANLRPTTAMWRVIGQGKWSETDETLLRRWQGKWKREGERLLEAARRERDERAAAQARREQPVVRSGVDMAAYIRASMPIGYTLPRSAIPEHLLGGVPSGIAAAVEKHERYMREQERFMQAYDRQDAINRAMKQIDQALIIQRAMKYGY